MTLTREDLQAISELLDEKLEVKLEEKLETKFDEKFDARLDAKFDEKLAPIENRLKRIEVDLIENNIIPRLNTIEACYLDTSARYIEYTDRMETAFQDIEVLKQVVVEHSEILQKIS